MKFRITFINGDTVTLERPVDPQQYRMTAQSICRDVIQDGDTFYSPSAVVKVEVNPGPLRASSRYKRKRDANQKG